MQDGAAGPRRCQTVAAEAQLITLLVRVKAGPLSWKTYADIKETIALEHLKVDKNHGLDSLRNLVRSRCKDT